jgi:succinate-semialdehyde dehydrogenase/glutarate-semialdehyde dehydrogenase
MATRKIAPALAAGCTVVIKPAQLTPLTTLFLAKLLEDAGLPAGVVNVVTSRSSRAVSEPILADPRLRKLSFTGSTEVGRSLMAQAAPGVLRTSMELGGNAPFLVFEDADLDAAVDGAIAAKFRNIGQACTAANRFLVHRSVADEFARRVTERVQGFGVGRGTEEGVTIGPLIDGDAVDKAATLVDDAVERGARITTGGSRIDGPGTFFQATVLSDVRPGSALLREEIFGPVLAIVPFDTEDEAVRIANRAARDGDAGAERRRGLQCGRALRRLEDVGPGPRGRRRGHPRVPADQVHAHADPLLRGAARAGRAPGR